MTSNIKLNAENLDNIYIELFSLSAKNTMNQVEFIADILRKNDKCDVQKFLENAKKINNVINQTIKILKQDNWEEKLKNILLEFNITDIILQNKISQDYDINIGKITKYDTKIHVNLNNNNCIFGNVKHDESLCYCEINPHGDVCFYCDSEYLYCDNKICKEKSIIGNNLNNTEIKKLFSDEEISIVTKKYTYDDELSDLIPKYLMLELSEDNIFNNLFLASLNNNTTYGELAEVIFYLCNDKFKYDEKWYEYNNNLWIISDNLDKFIRNEVHSYYKKIMDLLKEDINIEKQECNHIVKSIRKISNNFSSKKERDKMIKEIIFLSKKKNANFKETLDSNKKVIHFTNGLYKINDKILINHKSNHLISMTIGYNYIKKYSNNIDDLLAYLENILPDEDVREYFLTYLSKCLCSDGNENIITFLIGKCNSLIELIKIAFGDYYSNVINDANKRIYIIDKYDNLKNFKNIPLFVNINSCDNVIHDDKYRYIKLMNDIYENINIELWKQDFILLLLEYYYKINEEDNIPDIVKVSHKKLSSNELVILDFLSCCIKTGNGIFSTTLYDAYKNWYTTKNINGEIMGRNKFLIEIKKHCKYNKHITINKETSSGFENLQLTNTNTNTNIKKISLIYILLLENNKYYIGRTKDLAERFKQHCNGYGVEWTKLHKPIKIIYTTLLLNSYDENNYTKLYMKKYGIENVRGGSFCAIKLDKGDTNKLTKIINIFTDKNVETIDDVNKHFSQNTIKN